MNDRTAQRFLWLILLFSTALRVLYVLEIRDTDLFRIPFLDCLHYKLWATDLLHGDWGVGEAYWMGPLYPHLLALLYLVFGIDSIAPQLLQLLLSVMNIWLVFVLARRLATPGVAVLAALLFALYGPAVFYAGLLLMSAHLTTLLLLSVLQSVRCLERLTAGRVFVLGLLVGVAALARGNALLLLVTLPFLLATVASPRHRQPRRLLPRLGHLLWLGLLLWLGAAAAVLPITLRNLVVGRDLVLLTTNGGMNLFLGQRADLQGIFGRLDPDMVVQFDPSGELTLEREFGRDLKGSEVSHIFTRRALQVVAARPWETLRLYLVKSYRFWNGYEIPQLASFDYWRQKTVSLRLLWVPFTFIAAAGLAGLIMLPGRLRRVLGVFVGTYFASMLPFFMTSRYRQPIVPLLAIAAAAVLIAAWQGVARRAADGRWWGPRLRMGAWQLALVLVLVVAFLPQWATFDRAQAQWAIQMNRAGRLVRDGEKEAALAAIGMADAAYPDYAVTYLKLGDLHTKLQEDEQALAAFRQAEKLAPGEGIMPYRLGRTLHRLGRLDEAAVAFQRCIALDPVWPRGWFGLAMVQRERGDLQGAIEAMAQAVAVQPGAVHYRNNLASLYAENGQPVRAQETLQQLIADFPTYVKGYINLALVTYNLGQLQKASQLLDRAEAVPDQEPAEERAIQGIRQMIAAGPPLR